jgi:hypothetical protein
MAHLYVQEHRLMALRCDVVEAAGHAALQVVQGLPEELRAHEPKITTTPTIGVVTQCSLQKESVQTAGERARL